MKKRNQLMIIFCLLILFNASIVLELSKYILFVESLMMTIFVLWRYLKMEDLIETDRMTYFGELIGKMAHEINNPLAIIVGKAEGLLSHSEQENFDKELFVSHLMKIIQTSNRISHIIKQIGP